MSKKEVYNNSSGVIERIIDSLRGQLSAANLSLWIEPLKWVARDNKIDVLAPDCFFASHIRDNFLEKIQKAAGKVKISILVDEEQRLENKKELKTFLASPRPLPGMETYILRLNPENTFDNFVVDESNRLAYTICRELEGEGVEISGNIFLTGIRGCGKTHLLQSTARSLAEKFNQIIYVTADQFGKEFVSAVRSKTDNKMDVFDQKYTSCDVLFLDDIQEIVGRKKNNHHSLWSCDSVARQGKSCYFYLSLV